MFQSSTFFVYCKASPVGSLLPAAVRAGKEQIEVLPPQHPPQSRFQSFLFFMLQNCLHQKGVFSGLPAQFAEFSMLCGAPCSGGWGGSQIKVCSSAAQTARKLLQKCARILWRLPCRPGGQKPDTGRSGGLTLLFDHRRAAAQHHHRDGARSNPRFHGCGKKALPCKIRPASG